MCVYTVEGDESSCRTQPCTSRPRDISDVTPKHTDPTHDCSRIQRTHHYRDCLCNIGNSVPYDPPHSFKVLITPKTYDTEHKYINVGLFERRHTVTHDSPSTQKKNHCLHQNSTLQTLSSPKHPGTDVGEDNHHHQPREVTVEHDHKTLLRGQPFAQEP